MNRTPVVLGVGLVLIGALAACTDETTFTDEERAILATFRLPAQLPANPSNRVADDLGAAVLGKKFFFDTRFSGALGSANDGASGGSLGVPGAMGKVSCHACHQLVTGGADTRSRPGNVSLGVNYGARNAPTVINAAYSELWQLWDGRKDSLWAVALGPLEGGNEHAGTRLQYAHLIAAKYRAEYEAVFGPMPNVSGLPASGKPGEANYDDLFTDQKTAVNRIYSNLGKAIEAFERTLVSPNFEPSAFDRMLDALERGDEAAVAAAMSPAALRGAKLFIGKAACNECHRGPLFTDYEFHNVGCPQEGPNVPAADPGRSRGIALIMKDPMTRGGVYSDEVNGSHLAGLAEAPRDLGAFRTPSLRNIDKTAPYMHDGVYADLWDVMTHYNFGGGTGAYMGQKEPAIAPLLLDDRELNDLIEFLRTLSDGEPRSVDGFSEGLLAPPTLP